MSAGEHFLKMRFCPPPAGSPHGVRGTAQGSAPPAWRGARCMFAPYGTPHAGEAGVRKSGCGNRTARVGARFPCPAKTLLL
jgi:hypothetical protein